MTSGRPAFQQHTKRAERRQEALRRSDRRPAATEEQKAWPEGSFTWYDKDGKEQLSADTEVKADTEYEWVFISKDGNYEAEGIVTLWHRSSGGGSGSTKTETTTDPDGSSVTERKDANGSTGTVKTDKDGNTRTNAKLSDKAVEDAKKSGETVKVPAEVKAGESSNSAPTVDIDLPKGAGETEIEIPVDDVTPGTAAVIVHPDGTEEIVKDSVVTENGVRLIVDGGATVKIIDNTQRFIDTENHWAEDYIDFVSARGLLSGTGKNIFSPDSSTTRAQMWTVLARRAGTDPTGGATWYEKGQQWAVGNGISDGTSPDSSITRAQISPCSCGPWRRSNTTDITYPRAAHRPPGIFSGAENEQIEKC